MNDREKQILKRLGEKYGVEPEVTLDYEEPYQLLIATVLSAQCTDARVNVVTKELFKKYPTLHSFACADLSELEADIKPCGFYHMKALHIIDCMKTLELEYNGQVPSDIKELTSLPGVGRKTANVIRTHVFHEPSIVVDTHVKRISGKLGLTYQSDPVKIEFDLMKKLPKKYWSPLNLQLIYLGRTICTARSPKCTQCFLSDLCPYYIKNSVQQRKP